MVSPGPPNSEPGKVGDLPYAEAVTCWGVADDGTVVEVVVHRETVGVLLERWPPHGLVRADTPTAPIAHRVTAIPIGADGQMTLSPDAHRSWGGWDRVESDLALFAAERLTGLIAVHAAVIVRSDRALIVPGRSGAGKSTLCIAAIEAGAKVLTDEYALVDPATGWVTGWQRPIRVRRESGDGVDRLDVATASDPVPVGLIALVAHDSAARETWAPISASEAVMGILANTVCARSRPDEALDAALAIARSASAVAGPRGEAAPAIAELLALLDDGVA